MIREHFIDVEKLVKGTFVTDRPVLIPHELSKERALEDLKEEFIMDGKVAKQIWNLEDNFNKCTYVEMTIEINKIE